MEENGWNDVELRDCRYNQVVRMVAVATTEDKENDQYNLFSMHCAVDSKRQDEIVSQVCPGISFVILFCYRSVATLHISLLSYIPSCRVDYFE